MAGRPTDYNEEIIPKTRAYLECLPEGEVIPSIAGLSTFLGVSRDTLYEWMKVHPEFSYISKEVLSSQEKTLINKGLKNEFNSTIVKLMLGKHGYSDKAEVEQKTDITSGGAKITGMLIQKDEPAIQNKEQ